MVVYARQKVLGVVTDVVMVVYVRQKVLVVVTYVAVNNLWVSWWLCGLIILGIIHVHNPVLAMTLKASDFIFIKRHIGMCPGLFSLRCHFWNLGALNFGRKIHPPTNILPKHQGVPECRFYSADNVGENKPSNWCILVSSFFFIEIFVYNVYKAS